MTHSFPTRRSSDRGQGFGGGVALLGFLGQGLEQHPVEVVLQRAVVAVVCVVGPAHQQRGTGGVGAFGRRLRGAAGQQPVQQRAQAVDITRGDRKSVGEGNGVSVRVGLGRRRVIKKKKKTKNQT